MIFNEVTKQQLNSIAKRFKGTEVLETSILEYALTVERGFYNITLGGSDYIGADLPHNNYRYCEATIIKYGNNSIVVIVWGRRSTTPSLYPPVFNCYNSTEWGGWQTLATDADLANYLPLKGGKLTGSVTIEATNPIFAVVNSTQHGSLQAYNGKLGIYSSTFKKWFAYMDADGKGYVDGTASGNLPLTGGTVKTNSSDTPLVIESGSQEAVFLGFANENGRKDYIGFNASGDANIYGKGNILHTGNSAKVVISDTPLTAEGSIRVW